MLLIWALGSPQRIKCFIRCGLEAASIIVKNLISSTVDQVVFSKNKINDERIINAGVDAVYQYLIG
jgi:hypothetical protein